MAAEFDTQTDFEAGDERPAEPAAEQDHKDRGLWGSVGLLALTLLFVLLLLTQCTARVPSTIGLTPTQAKLRLTDKGYKVGLVSEAPLLSGKPGLVQEQAPAPGAVTRRGVPVDLIVASGGDLVLVPNVQGRTTANATVMLEQAGFETANAAEYSDTVPRGKVVEQDPLGGTRARAGSVVTVYYSLGPHSEADVYAAPMDTNDGLTAANRDSVGSNQYPPMMTCTAVYPQATAWSSGGDIYVRLRPGGAARRVTSTGDWDTDPVISPSHKYLVFLRAPGAGKKATGVGAVCFTSFKTYMLSQLPISLAHTNNLWYGKPVFAPGPKSTTPDTDWIVYAQYWPNDYYSTDEYYPPTPLPSARLIICNVPLNSKWVSWNEKFRPARTLTITRSSKPGCVHVKKTNKGKVIYERDFNATTGLYLR